MSKVTINLPTALVENIDYLVEQTDTDRTDVITEILDTVMESGDLLDMIFGEALEEASQDDNAGNNESEDNNDDETEEEEAEDTQKEDY